MAVSNAPGAYIPDAGDVVWVNFNPQLGHEQAGHRPALVLSPAGYNQKTKLMVCCPITSKVKGYPFEVKFSLGGQPAAVLSDQLRTLDWVAREARYKASLEPETLRVVKAKIKALLQLQ